MGKIPTVRSGNEAIVSIYFRAAGGGLVFARVRAEIRGRNGAGHRPATAGLDSSARWNDEGQHSVDTVIPIKRRDVRAGFRTAHSSCRHPSERWGPAAISTRATTGLDSSLRWTDGVEQPRRYRGPSEDGVVRIASGSDAASRIFLAGHCSFRHPSERWGPAADTASATAGLDSSLRWNDGGLAVPQVGLARSA